MVHLQQWLQMCHQGDIHKINFTNVTTHFKLGEFFKGIPPARLKEVKLEHLQNIQHLCYILEVIRDHFGKPIVISSQGGWRDKKTQQALVRKGTGAKNSQHLLGNAIDFNVSGVAPRVVQQWLISIKTKYSIGTGASFTHLDRRLQTLRFGYS